MQRQAHRDRARDHDEDARERYTYGYGRAEDLGGLFVIAMITLSSVLAA